MNLLIGRMWVRYKFVFFINATSWWLSITLNRRGFPEVRHGLTAVHWKSKDSIVDGTWQAFIIEFFFTGFTFSPLHVNWQPLVREQVFGRCLRQFKVTQPDLKHNVIQRKQGLRGITLCFKSGWILWLSCHVFNEIALVCFKGYVDF